MALERERQSRNPGISQSGVGKSATAEGTVGTRGHGGAAASLPGPAFWRGADAAVHAGGCSSARKTLRLGSQALLGAVVLQSSRASA